MNTILFEDYRNCPVESLVSYDILILKTSYDRPLDAGLWDSLLHKLTPNLKEEVKKYKRWQDQHNTLLGKMLVHLAYGLISGEKLDFKLYKRDNNNRPYLDNSSINFNISHTDQTVLCAITCKDLALGIDIEKCKSINFNSFKHVFHKNELINIQKDTTTQFFFNYWTRKEAFTKAIGQGILLPLNQIDTTKRKIFYKEKDYYLQSFTFHECQGALALNKSTTNKKWLDIHFENASFGTNNLSNQKYFSPF